nr:ubiquinol-cytochrome C reductase hinge protein [Naematelia aurantialba]
MASTSLRNRSSAKSQPPSTPPTPTSGDGGPSWLERRETLVEMAIDHEDVESLRKLSALPGGFGSNDMRKRAWLVLLHTRHYFPDPTPKADPDEDTDPGDHSEAGPPPTEPPIDEAPDQEDTNSSDGKEGAKEEEGDGEIAEPFHHPDEGQVLLDTRRSFVSYPRGLPKESKVAMQADLQDLIVGVLRNFPKLSYFQGYHDIMSVLYLTFIPPKPRLVPRSRTASSGGLAKSRSGSPHTPPNRPPTPLTLPPTTEKPAPVDEKQFELETSEVLDPPASSTEQPDRTVSVLEDASRDTPDWILLRHCAEVVSLCRVRDAMAKGMEPMMALLRILKRLLRAADPQLSKFSAMISPVPTLPFFALSWILCLFSHDIDTLEPVQRMFDYLLARNPISAIYLAVAILIAKKPQMYELAAKLGEEAQDDPTLLHPLFSRLPPLYPDTPGEPTDLSIEETADQTSDLVNLDDAPNPYKPIPLSQLFEIADRLMLQHPWDGDTIRGRELLGDGCTVCTYAAEDKVHLGGKWSLAEAMAMLDEEVVKPGAMIVDEDEEEEAVKEDEAKGRKNRPVRARRWSIRVPRDKKGTVLALGIVVVGVGIAVFAGRAGGRHADWARWWSVVLRSWVSTQASTHTLKETVVAYGRVLRHVAQSLLDPRL